MRTVIGFLLLACLTGGCMHSAPEKVAGNWSGALDVNVSPVMIEIVLKQTDDKISGTYGLVQMQAKIGFEGKLEGKVDGTGVEFEMAVPAEEKKRLGWSDLKFTGVVTQEDGGRIIKGRVIKEVHGKKESMESAFLPKQ